MVVEQHWRLPGLCCPVVGLHRSRIPSAGRRPIPVDPATADSRAPSCRPCALPVLIHCLIEVALGLASRRRRSARSGGCRRERRARVELERARFDLVERHSCHGRGLHRMSCRESAAETDSVLRARYAPGEEDAGSVRLHREPLGEFVLLVGKPMSDRQTTSISDVPARVRDDPRFCVLGRPDSCAGRGDTPPVSTPLLDRRVRHRVPLERLRVAELHPSGFARDEIVPSAQQDVLEVLQVGELAWLVIGQSRIPNLSRSLMELPSRSIATRTGARTAAPVLEIESTVADGTAVIRRDQPTADLADVRCSEHLLGTPGFLAPDQRTTPLAINAFRSRSSVMNMSSASDSSS